MFGWPCWRDFGFCLFCFFGFWARAFERPRSKRNCFPEGCRFSVIILTCVRCFMKYVRCFVRKIGPRRVENRAPRAPKWPSGGLRGALGRQFGARWPGGPLRRRSWAALWAVLAALGPLLAPLWAVLALPGGRREAPGGSGEGLREAILVLFWMVQRQKLKKLPKTSYFNDF